MIINPSTLSNKLMSLISIDQFEEFVDAYPEMEQFYDFRYDSTEEELGDTSTD